VLTPRSRAILFLLKVRQSLDKFMLVVVIGEA